MVLPPRTGPNKGILGTNRFCACPPELQSQISPALAANSDQIIPSPHATLIAARTRRPWWSWIFLFGLEILDKMKIPTATLREWVTLRLEPAAQEEAVVFEKLTGLATPTNAYRWLRTSYDQQQSLDYLLRFVAHHRPLVAGTPWDITVDVVETMARDELHPITIELRAKVIARQESFFLGDPFIRLYDAVDEYALKHQEIPPSTMHESITTTDTHLAYLSAEREGTEADLASQVFLAAAKEIQNIPPGDPIRVKIGAFPITLINFENSVTAQCIPQECHGSFGTYLTVLGRKLSGQEERSPLETAAIKHIIDQSPGFQHFLQHHLNPLDEAEQASTRGTALLRQAQIVDSAGLRSALFAIRQQSGRPMGLHIPGEPRMTILWGTRGTGYGTSLSVTFQPEYYLGPFHFAPSRTMKVTTDNRIDAIPALEITDRRGSTFHFSADDLAHFWQLSTYLREHPAVGDARFRQAFCKLEEDLMAAHVASGRDVSHFPNIAPSVMRRAQAIQQTNWGIGLLHDVDALWEEMVAIHEYETVRKAGHHSAIRGQLSAMVAMGTEHLWSEFQGHFDPEHARLFREGLRQIPIQLASDNPNFLRIKESLVVVVASQLQAIVQNRPWLAWPGTRSFHFVNHLQLLLQIPPAHFAERLAAPELAEEWHNFVEDMIEGDIGPSLETARTFIRGDNYPDARAEYYRILREPNANLEIRLGAMADLVTESAQHQDWWAMELALREMAHAVTMGYRLPDSAIDAITTLFSNREELPVRVPTAILFVLRYRLKVTPEESRMLRAWGETSSRIAEALPVLPNEVDSLPNPWERWHELSPTRQARFLALVDTAPTLGIIDPQPPTGTRYDPGAMRNFSPLLAADKRTYDAWAPRLFGTRPPMVHLPLMRRLEQFREGMGARIAQALDEPSQANLPMPDNPAPGEITLVEEDE